MGTHDGEFVEIYECGICGHREFGEGLAMPPVGRHRCLENSPRLHFTVGSKLVRHNTCEDLGGVWQLVGYAAIEDRFPGSVAASLPSKVLGDPIDGMRIAAILRCLVEKFSDEGEYVEGAYTSKQTVRDVLSGCLDALEREVPVATISRPAVEE